MSLPYEKWEEWREESKEIWKTVEGEIKVKPETNRRYKEVGGGTGTFVLYEDERIVENNPESGRVIVEMASQKDTASGGKEYFVHKMARMKKNWIKQADSQEIEKFRREGMKATKKRRQIEDLSKLVRELLADPRLPTSMVEKLPMWAQQLDPDDLNSASLIIGSAIFQAIDPKNPRSIMAAEFLRKVGYGDKIDVNLSADSSFFQKPVINFEVVENKIDEGTIKGAIEGEVVKDEDI